MIYSNRNASATEALPIFLSAVVDEVMAIILSVTAVLLFGEIIPASILTGESIIRYYNSKHHSPIRKLYLFFTRTESVEDCSYFDPVGILRDVPFLSGGVSPVPGAGLLHRT